MSSKPDLLEHDFGYDPTIDEPIENHAARACHYTTVLGYGEHRILAARRTAAHPELRCLASTYGLATFTAARAGQYAPNEPSLQASSAYIYIQVMKQDGISQIFVVART